MVTCEKATNEERRKVSNTDIRLKLVKEMSGKNCLHLLYSIAEKYFFFITAWIVI
jgi:hypothetical protein